MLTWYIDHGAARPDPGRVFFVSLFCVEAKVTMTPRLLSWELLNVVVFLYFPLARSDFGSVNERLINNNSMKIADVIILVLFCF